jgi:K+-transporting ATPase ATPase C chain
MLTQIKRSVLLAILFTLVLGLAYPLLEVGLANALFGHQATESLGPNGSTLIGQPFTSTRWFHGRPDAYNDTETGGTNLGPRSKVLLDQTRKLVAWWHAHGVDPTQELVTTSASGVDPYISPRSAVVQIPMVARATGVSPLALAALVRRDTKRPEYGFLGERVVDVLKLNEGLAALGHDR